MTAFEDVAEGRSGCIVQAALEICLDEYPDFDINAGIQTLEDMAVGFEIYRDIHVEPGADVLRVLSALNDYFFLELGFSGSVDEYYDPRNSYLCDVLERRTGIPITLSLIYQFLAAHAGVVLTGVNLPGHFMLALVEPNGSRQYIDVFHGGQFLNWDECCEQVEAMAHRRLYLKESDFPPMNSRQMLTRLLRNLKGIYSHRDFRRALHVQERLMRLLPDDPHEQRDLGLLYTSNGKPMQGLRTLQDLIKRHPALEDVEFIRDSLRRAAREAALVN